MILSEQKAEIEKIKANLVQQHRTLQERTLKLAGAIEAMQLVEQKFVVDDEDALIEVDVSDSDNN